MDVISASVRPVLVEWRMEKLACYGMIREEGMRKQ